MEHLGGGVPVHDVVGTPENALHSPVPPEEALATAVEEQGGREHGAAPVLDRSVLDRVPEAQGGSFVGPEPPERLDGRAARVSDQVVEEQDVQSFAEQLLPRLQPLVVAASPQPGLGLVLP